MPDLDWVVIYAYVEKYESDLKAYIDFVGAQNPNENGLARLEMTRAKAHTLCTALKDFFNSTEDLPLIIDDIGRRLPQA